MQSQFRDKNDIKIFILYLLRHIGYPLDFVSINDIVVQDGYVGYFDFVECFAELLETGNILEIPAEEGREELYEIMAKYKDVVLCTGHVHHGLGEMAGLFAIDGYHVLDIPGFKNSTYGYGYDESNPDAEIRHCGYIAYLFGRTILLRAAEFAACRWLPAYDQLVTLP